MSRAEKRWNRLAGDLNWDRRPDGTYQAPPQAVPFLIASLVLMILLGFLAPQGIDNAHGASAGAAVLVLLLLIGTMVLLVVFGQNSPATVASAPEPPPIPQTPPQPTQPPPPPSAPVLRPALGKIARGVGWVLSFRWLSGLPDWAQSIAWALFLTCPPALVALRWRSARSTAWDPALVLALVFGCAAIFRLFHLLRETSAVRRARREEDDAGRAEARGRFRAAVLQALTTRPIPDFDFESLIASHAMSRFDADYVAALIDRRFSD